MLQIKVEDWYNLYRKHTFEFNPGLTCLVGKNGAGKSTLLREIREWAKDNNVDIFYYDNENSEKNNMSDYAFHGQWDRVARNFSSSEGQNIRNNFEDKIYEIGRYIRKCIDKNNPKAIILLDGLDSGISLDYVITLKKDLVGIIKQDCIKHNIEPYIIVSANNYEFCNGEDCLRVSDAKHFIFKDYNDFRKIYLIRSKKDDKN